VRRAFLLGLVASAAVIVAGTEILSSARALGRGSLAALALLAAAVFAASIWRRDRALRENAGLTRFDRSIAGALAIAAVLTLIVAAWAPPNTWDSMTYHTARVAEWYDHGSVAFYPTPIDRQLWQPPFAEYLVLVAYGALGGRDYLANLPAWIAAIGAAVAAMEIASLLGAPRSLQRVAALVVATTPTVILEASSTQNDIVAALWLSIAAYLTLAECLEPRARSVDAVIAGAAFGLAAGTKGTALPIGLPWLLAFVAVSFRSAGSRTGMRQAGLAVIAILALNAAQYARNLDAYGNVLGPAYVQAILRPASLAPADVVSNLATNASIHMGTPWVEVNAALERAIVTAHRVAGLDLKQLYPYFGGFRVVPWSTDEGLAGNPLQFLLAIFGAVWGVFAWRRLRNEHRLTIAVLGASALLLGETVRWQPFNGRLHLPLFVLAAPCIALLLGKLRRPWMVVVAGVLAAGAAPALLSNNTRPLLALGTLAPGSVLRVPRDQQYFAARPELYRTYASLIRRVSDTGCTRVGLVADYDSWEYPLWALGRPTGLRFSHQPRSLRAPLAPDADACLWIGLDPPPELRPPSSLHLLWQEPPLSLWRQ